MSIMSWAENEVKLACDREMSGVPDGEWEYGIGCYKSALKAFKSLCEDEHSGCSIGITIDILNRLCRHKPLTPVYDIADVWNKVCDFDDKRQSYQCKRMPSLFKDIDKDGNVTYNDVERVICVNIHNSYDRYHCGFVSSLINDTFPIKMPYSSEKLRVYCEEFLYDRKNGGDYDTLGVLFMLNENCDSVAINKFYKESDSSETGFEEITKDEYEERKLKFRGIRSDSK